MGLGDLPSKAYIPVGNRGMEAFNLRECMKCGNQNEDELELLDKQDTIERDGNKILNIKTYKIKCNKCGTTYRIIVKSLYIDKQIEENRLTSVVNYAEDGKEQWLGVF
jgi:DNA-directed RNA polymerase subunit RPC12/RpoP